MASPVEHRRRSDGGSYANSTRPNSVGILTVSDSCYNGRAEDRSGSNLMLLVEDKELMPDCKVIERGLVPDDMALIKEKLIDWCDQKHLNLVFTTGGTGFSPRDITPEATRAVIEKEAYGLSQAMLMGSLKITPLAVLSRPACGIRGKTLIINLPGSKKGSQECIEILAPVLGHALDLLRGHHGKVKATHNQLQVDGSHHHRRDHHSPRRSHHNHGNHNHHRGHHRDNSNSSESLSSVDTRVARRHRSSPYPMISVQDAVDTVLSECLEPDVDIIKFSSALGYYLAEDVYANDSLPPFPASIMDGYAVKASDGSGRRRVLGASTAGAVPAQSVTPGNVIRISTGAPLPTGADAVVKVEDTKLIKASSDEKTEIEVEILVHPKVGQDIRPVGYDLEEGEKILSANTYLGPSEVAMLATVGVTEVKCYKKPRVGVLSTGNELIEPGEKLKPGKVRDSNRTALLCLLREEGYTPVDLGIAKDNPQSLLQQLLSALAKVDLIITSGGVSMGEKDLLKEVLTSDLKAEVKFGQVRMKPGKPTTLATTSLNGKKKMFLCLPGNPVSALVTCHLYAVPALRKVSGNPEPMNTIIKAKLDNDINLDPRPEYHRVRLRWKSNGDGYPIATSTGNQMSSRLMSLCSANALLVLPAKTDELTRLSKGSIVDAMLIGRL